MSSFLNEARSLALGCVFEDIDAVLLAIESAKKINNDFKVKIDRYRTVDDLEVETLALHGKMQLYDKKLLSVLILFESAYPRNPPIIRLNYNRNYTLNTNCKYVNRCGIVTLPYLNSWTNDSTINKLFEEICDALSRDFPLMECHALNAPISTNNHDFKSYGKTNKGLVAEPIVSPSAPMYKEMFNDTEVSNSNTADRNDLKSPSKSSFENVGVAGIASTTLAAGILYSMRSELSPYNVSNSDWTIIESCIERTSSTITEGTTNAASTINMKTVSSQVLNDIRGSLKGAKSILSEEIDWNKIVHPLEASLNQDVLPSLSQLVTSVTSGMSSLNLADTTKDMIGIAANSVAYVAGKVLEVVNSPEVSQLLHTFSKMASAIPIAGTIGLLTQAIIEQARIARYNKLAADALKDRVIEVGMALVELLRDITETTPALTVELTRLQKLLVQSQEFMVLFSKKGYLRRLFSGTSDADSVRFLDKQLADVISSIQLTLGIKTIKLQMRALGELDTMKKILVRSGGAIGLGSDPVAIKELAACSGLTETELQDELHNTLTEISQSQNRIEEKLQQIVQMHQGSVSRNDDSVIEQLWQQYFGRDRRVSADLFLPVFEEEFNQGNELPSHTRTSIIVELDRNPKDGYISFLEWKKFYQACQKEGLSPLEYIIKRNK